MEMIKEGDRFGAAVKYSDFRQVPIKDDSGLDYTKSVREVEPRSALELIVRHFTDSPEQKRERRLVKESASQQIKSAEERSINTAKYSVMRDKIARDHYRAAGVTAEQVVPELNAKEIAELREFAESLPAYSTDRREFTDGASRAERANQQREATEAARRDQEARALDQTTQAKDQSPSRVTADVNRTDRDSYSRGR
jgi:hypothetical protein